MRTSALISIASLAIASIAVLPIGDPTSDIARGGSGLETGSQVWFSATRPVSLQRQASDIDPYDQPDAEMGAYAIFSESRQAASPVGGGNYAEHQHALFDVPVEPGRGLVRIAFFISAKNALSVNGGVGGGRILGNDRGFNPDFLVDRSKVAIEIDFETGRGAAYVSPTCVEANVAFVEQTICHNALPLDTTDSGSQFLYSVNDENGSEGASGSASYVTFDFHLKDSAFEKFIGLNAGVPAIDGRLTITSEPNGEVCAIGLTDTYPSIEVYQIKRLADIDVLIQSSEGASPLSLVNPPGKDFLECSSVGLDA